MKNILTFIRRLLGTDQLHTELQQVRDESQRLRRELHALLRIEILNTAQQIIHSKKIRETEEYACYKKILSLLQPLHVKDGQYLRIGKNGDGGYTMLNYPNWKTIESAYSFGINDDVSWDEEMANRGIPVFMYDHTISRLPKQHQRFHYLQMGITGFNKAPQLKTLKELLTMNGHEKSNQLILKMDVEGCEWDVFSEVDSDTINQFAQIVIELHDLTTLQNYDTVIAVLNKINQTHQSVHIHANNYSTPIIIGDIVICPTLEVLYVRRSDVQFVNASHPSPALLDQPNNPALPDIAIRFHLNE